MCSGLCRCLQLWGPKCQTAMWKGPDWSAGWWEMCSLAAAITPASCQTCEWCCPGPAKSSWSARWPQKQKWIHLQPHGAEKTYPSCCYSVGQLCLTLCDPMDWSMRGPPVPHHLLEFAQVHVHCIGDILVKPAQIINHRIISINVALNYQVFGVVDNILKSRNITSPTKVRLVKAMVFPVVMYGCESWTVKKAERRRINAFELWCWRRVLRVPWTARRSNQSFLKISPECSLEGLMLKLKLQ